MSRVDCWPERLGGHDLPTMYSCRARNCVWDEHVSHPDVPVCYFPHNNTGYTMSSLDPDGPNAYKAVLRRKGKGPFGKDFPLAEFRVEEYGENVLRVMIDTVSHNRFRPPVPLNLPQNKATDQQKYKLVVDNKDPLAFSVYRLDNGVQGEKIWSTSADSLVFADQFLQLTAAIPSYVYGLGENTKNTFKRDTHYKTYPIFA
ncbi:sucrase-isomaltase, intestinal, partial [Aplysia californica]|uniref:Sucrase-isomaltase, intestinal n=1 Tax=Aplysia californica TaxID=6500 RepID=A0ABM1ADP2_APLCA